MTDTLESFSGAATHPLLRVTAPINDDGPERAFPYLNTPPRAAAVRVERVLRLLAGFGALRRDQLESLLVGDAQLTAASRRVATHRATSALRERGLVAAVALPGAGTTALRGYALTERGRRLYAESDTAYPRRRVERPLSVSLLDHAVALAQIAIAFRDAAVQAHDVALLWESDWEAVARAGCTLAIPDALVTLEQGGWRTRAFVEADRSTEWNSAFSEKVRRYVELYHRAEWRSSLGAWPLILTVTMSDVRARSLARLAARVTLAEGGARIARSFLFSSLEDVRTPGPLAPIWHVGGRSDPVPMLEDASDEVRGRQKRRP